MRCRAAGARQYSVHRISLVDILHYYGQLTESTAIARRAVQLIELKLFNINRLIDLYDLTTSVLIRSVGV